MVTIGMDYRVLPGKEDVFEGACRKVLEVMEEAAGHEGSRIFRRVDPGAPEGEPAPSEYLIVSRWRDEGAFREFIGSEAFRKVTSWGLANVLAGRPSHTTYREG